MKMTSLLWVSRIHSTYISKKHSVHELHSFRLNTGSRYRRYVPIN